MTIKQDCIPLESPKEWSEALNGIKHTFGHTWENCNAMYLTTGLKTYLYYFIKDKIRIVCPIAERKFGGYIDIVKPFGFSGFIGNGDFFEFKYYWENFVRERGYVCGYLGLNPIFDYSSHFNSEDIFIYDTIYILDLSQNIDELFENMSRNRKRQLKDWENINFNLVHDNSILENFFFEEYVHFFRRKNASSIYSFSKKTMSFLFSSDNVKLIGIRNSGKLVSVSVFTYTGDVGDHLFNVCLPEAQHHIAALTWYGVNYLKSLQIPIINLGGGEAGEYKRRFGSKALPLKCIKQIYRPEIYENLCRQVNADPKDKTGYFPAYRKEEFELQNQKVKITCSLEATETIPVAKEDPAEAKRRA
jgi:hypothetical protein